MSPSDNLKYS